MVYTYKGMLFSTQEEENSDTCYHIDKPWGHYACWNKPVTKGQGMIPLKDTCNS